MPQPETEACPNSLYINTVRFRKEQSPVANLKVKYASLRPDSQIQGIGRVGEKFFELNMDKMATRTSDTTHVCRGCCSSTNLEQAPQVQTKKNGNIKTKQLEGARVHSLTTHQKISNK